jgi:hypothetical protein
VSAKIDARTGDGLPSSRTVERRSPMTALRLGIDLGGTEIESR